MRGYPMRRWIAPILVLIVLSLTAAACTAESPPPPAATPDIGATVTAMVEDIPTQAPYPTSTASPTYTPIPTYTAIPPATPYPTYTPIPPATPYPTHTPAPTAQPYPTHTPAPTYTPAPTATPYPTLAALPTYTPYPTYTPSPTLTPTVRTVVKHNNWKIDGRGNHTALGTGETRGGTWLLVLNCVGDEEPIAWIWRAVGNIFTSADYGDDSLLADHDGDSREQTWTYVRSDDGDFYKAKWAEPTIEQILKSQQVTYTIPTSGEPYVVAFDIAGLDQHIGEPDDLCK